jgi:cytochrome c-type protein NapB
MRQAILTTLLGAALFSSGVLSAQAEEIASLRGTTNLDAPANPLEKNEQMKVDGGFDRAWDLQPPSIPHDIEKDRISLTENTCIKCHSKENFEKENAPEIGESHYIARDGSQLEQISSRRHFCDQCHTPQADIEPLVENSF